MKIEFAWVDKSFDHPAFGTDNLSSFGMSDVKQWIDSVTNSMNIIPRLKERVLVFQVNDDSSS